MDLFAFLFGFFVGLAFVGSLVIYAAFTMFFHDPD